MIITRNNKIVDDWHGRYRVCYMETVTKILGVPVFKDRRFIGTPEAIFEIYTPKSEEA